MKCPKCHHENFENVHYCGNCGFPLAEQSKDWTSILLFAWCASLLFFAIAYAVLPYLLQWSNRLYIIITAILSAGQALTNFVIPYVVPKTSLKIASFIIVIIYAVYVIIGSYTMIVTQGLNIN